MKKTQMKINKTSKHGCGGTFQKAPKVKEEKEEHIFDQLGIRRLW